MAKRAVIPPTKSQNSFRCRTIAHRFLDLEREEGFPVTDAEYETLDGIIAEAESKLKVKSPDSKTKAVTALRNIYKLLSKKGFRYQSLRSLSQALKSGGSNCITSSFIYKAIAETLGLPIVFSRAPAHLFIRWRFKDDHINWETTSTPAGECSDEYYKKIFSLAQSSIAKGVYLNDLTETETSGLLQAHIGYMLHMNKEINRAIDHYKKALVLYPKHAETHHNFGVALAMKGEHCAAIEAFTTAIELHPLSRDTYNKRSIAYHKIGEKEKAIDDTYAAFELQ